MKKRVYICILLACALILSLCLASCGGGTESADGGNGQQSGSNGSNAGTNGSQDPGPAWTPADSVIEKPQGESYSVIDPDNITSPDQAEAELILCSDGTFMYIASATMENVGQMFGIPVPGSASEIMVYTGEYRSTGADKAELEPKAAYGKIAFSSEELQQAFLEAISVQAPEQTAIYTAALSPEGYPASDSDLAQMKNKEYKLIRDGMKALLIKKSGSDGTSTVYTYDSEYRVIARLFCNPDFGGEKYTVESQYTYDGSGGLCAEREITTREWADSEGKQQKNVDITDYTVSNGDRTTKYSRSERTDSVTEWFYDENGEVYYGKDVSTSADGSVVTTEYKGWYDVSYRLTEYPDGSKYEDVLNDDGTYSEIKTEADGTVTEIMRDEDGRYAGELKYYPQEELYVKKTIKYDNDGYQAVDSVTVLDKDKNPLENRVIIPVEECVDEPDGIRDGFYDSGVTLTIPEDEGNGIYGTVSLALTNEGHMIAVYADIHDEHDSYASFSNGEYLADLVAIALKDENGAAFFTVYLERRNSDWCASYQSLVNGNKDSGAIRAEHTEKSDGSGWRCETHIHFSDIYVNALDLYQKDLAFVTCEATVYGEDSIDGVPVWQMSDEDYVSARESGRGLKVEASETSQEMIILPFSY